MTINLPFCPLTLVESNNKVSHFVYFSRQMCCLCPMRGGAMKRTSDSRWAHILCTLMVPGATFKDAINKDPINVLTIMTDTCNKTCYFCAREGGACLTCNKCTNLFHPLCGLVAGATFTIPAYNSQELQVQYWFARRIRSYNSTALKHNTACKRANAK